MALIKCPECGKEISDLAIACVHCGCPIHKIEPKPTTGTIGYRGNQNGLPYWIGMFLLSILFIVSASIMFKYNFQSILSTIVMIGGIALFLECIYFFFIIAKNSNNKSDCVIYNAENDHLIVTTLNGRTYTINREDFISVKANFMSSFLVKFTYRQKGGTIRTLNLGYCADREYLVRKLNLLRE